LQQDSLNHSVFRQKLIEAAAFIKNPHLMQNNFSFSTGYFGKLPHYADFVKFNSGGPEILAFDKWIQEGMVLAKQKLKNDWKNNYSNLPSYNFFYPFTGTQNVLLGLLYPGKDKTGREFPFFVFCIVSRDLLWNVPVYLIPLFFREFFGTAKQLLQKALYEDNLQEINSELNNISLRTDSFKIIENVYQKFISETRQSELKQRSGSSGIETINSKSSFINFSFTTNEEFTNLDTAFYIHLICKLIKDSAYQPVVFWTKKNSVITLDIFTSKPEPADFIDLFAQDVISDQSSGEVTGLFSLNSLIENETRSLKDLLKSI
jgi:type VI secretion system ImpM family protein